MSNEHREKYKDNYDYPNSVFYEKNDEIERLRSEIKHGCINCANDVDTTIKELEIEIQSLKNLIVDGRKLIEAKNTVGYYETDAEGKTQPLINIWIEKTKFIGERKEDM